MSLDITTLQLLKHREKHDKLHRAVPAKALDAHTQTIIKDFGRYFREFPDAQAVEVGPFMHWFKLIHPKLSAEATTVIEQVMRRAAEEPSPGIEEGIMGRWVAAASAAELTDILTRWQEGEEIDLFSATKGAVERFELELGRKVKSPQVLDAIEDLLKAEENDTGMHWRLPCLNRHIKPLVGGDFIVVAARPDKGKTTFMASELTHMAAQVDALYPDQKRSILWFNNEGPGHRIVMRCFQAALNATTEDLVKLSNEPADPEFSHYRTQVRQQYAKALGGRPGVLRIMDIHGLWNHEVEAIIEAHRPAVVVFDMVDNIKFGGATTNNGERTDQLLEAMYQWARLIGVKHDCAVLATSQISAEGDGMQYPTLPQLKDSRTGKQGAADVIITLGAVNDPSLAKSRYIGTTKNKKVRTGVPSSPQAEVYFDSDRGRYKEYSQ
jgi:replicative DNA helicase